VGLAPLWPFISDDLTLRTQLFAVQVMGHPLTMWEAREMLRTASNDRSTIESRIGGRTDARLFSGARTRLDETLQPGAQGLSLSTREVARLVYPLLEHRTLGRLSSAAVQELIERVEYQIRTLPEYQDGPSAQPGVLVEQRFLSLLESFSEDSLDRLGGTDRFADAPTGSPLRPRGAKAVVCRSARDNG
jgi:hypothetical protein